MSIAVKSRLCLALLLCAGLGQAAIGAGVGDAPALKSPVTTAPDSEHSMYSSYRLGVGDVISIIVFDEPSLSKEKLRLTDAGTIFYPALGELRILGKTIGELERQIVEGLKGRILVNPRVSVQVDEYRPFFVSGMIGKPGSYPYQPGLTVRKAVSLAGGFNERASLSKIFVIREGDPTNRSVKVDLDAPIGPGDIITVEESFF